MKNSLYIFLLLFFVTNVTVWAEPQHKVEICDKCHKPKNLCECKPTPPKPPKASKEFTCTFSCEPKSATLYIDGHKMGPANGTYKLKKGKHMVKLVANGYQELKKTIHVNKGKTSFHFPMDAIKFDVNMATNVNGATLYCDGEYKGTTPCSLKLKAGSHRVELTAEGYDNYLENVYVSEEGTNYLFSMTQMKQQKQDEPQEQKEYVVRFLCNDPDAKIIIDNNHNVKANETIKLAYGKHSVQLESTSHNDSTAIISVDKNHTSFDFALGKKRSEPSRVNPPEPKTNKLTEWFENIEWELDYDHSFTASYSFASHFPYGLSLYGTMSHVLIGFDWGLNHSETEKYFDETDNKEKYLNWWYVMGALGFYYKYFSAQCGAGIMSRGPAYEKKQIIGFVDSSDQFPKGNFCCKPSLTGFIPVRDNGCLSISVGYLFIPNYNKLNGFSCSLGYQWLLD